MELCYKAKTSRLCSNYDDSHFRVSTGYHEYKGYHKVLGLPGPRALLYFSKGWETPGRAEEIMVP